MSDTMLSMVGARLPDGWRCDRRSGRREIVVVACWFGSVTIDMERRAFQIGDVCFVSRYNTATYEGRGWRDRLIDDAVASLRATAPAVRPT